MATAQRTEGMPVMNCLDHSGMATRMNIGIGLLTILCGLFGYSSFIQLPQMERRISSQINTIENRVTKCETDIGRVIAQRNFDHQNKDPLR